VVPPEESIDTCWGLYEGDGVFCFIICVRVGCQHISFCIHMYRSLLCLKYSFYVVVIQFMIVLFFVCFAFYFVCSMFLYCFVYFFSLCIWLFLFYLCECMDPCHPVKTHLQVVSIIVSAHLQGLGNFQFVKVVVDKVFKYHNYLCPTPSFCNAGAVFAISVVRLKSEH
jgi:hypothetical protein